MITAVQFAVHWWWLQEVLKRLQYVDIVFIGCDFQYKAIYHFRFSLPNN